MDLILLISLFKLIDLIGGSFFIYDKTENSVFIFFIFKLIFPENNFGFSVTIEIDRFDGFNFKKTLFKV